jgi:hypothetical protein
MLDACASGDVAALRRLFEALDIRKGSEPVNRDNCTPDGPPRVAEMLEVAVVNGNSDIVFFILETYERIDFYSLSPVLKALLEHPDLAILEALYNQDNRVINFEWDDMTTFVNEACSQPPEKIAPLILFAVEHDWHFESGFYLRGLTAGVFAAVRGDQPLAVIEAMIKKGAPIYSTAAEMAVECERVDVLEAFIRLSVKGEGLDVDALRTKAQETGNKKVINLVDIWTGKRRGLFDRLGFDSLWRRICG